MVLSATYWKTCPWHSLHLHVQHMLYEPPDLKPTEIKGKAHIVINSLCMRHYMGVKLQVFSACKIQQEPSKLINRSLGSWLLSC